MKALLPVIVLSLLPLASGDELESLHEQPWVGFWVGYEEKEFDFGIGAKGLGELFMKQKKLGEMDRISPLRAVKFNYRVKEQDGAKWFNRSMDKTGFETSQAATNEPEKVEFNASYKGGAVARITHTFDGDEIRIAMKWVKKPEGAAARIGVEIVIPDLYRLSSKMDERDIKRKMKHDEVRAVRLDKTTVKLDLDEEVNLSDEKYLSKGATKFEITSNQLAKKTLTFSNSSEKAGVFLFEQKKELHAGFTATWYPDETMADAELVIEID